MTPKQFKDWRKSRNLKQREIADLLGLKKRIIQYYEKGERDGQPLSIPKHVELACYAISQGVLSFDGSARAIATRKKRAAGTGVTKPSAAKTRVTTPPVQAKNRPGRQASAGK